MIPNTSKLVLRNIDHLFDNLQKEMIEYEKSENKIETNLDRIQRFRFSSSPYLSVESKHENIILLNDAILRITRINHRRLRDIDNIAAQIASMIALLIDECMDSYTLGLKIEIRLRIQRLNDIRTYKVGEVDDCVAFPTASGILYPYVIKTRVVTESSNFISIRNAIRSFSES